MSELELEMGQSAAPSEKPKIGRDEIVVEGYLQKKIFPKDFVEAPGTFAIFVLDVAEIIDGKIDNSIKMGKYYKEGFLTFKGSVPELANATRYKITAKLSKDPKYGSSYEIKMMNVVADVSDDEGVRRFLSYLLSDNIIDNIFKKIGNPVKFLEAGDVDKLCEVNGVGELTARKIIAKYNNSKDNSYAYAELYKYGMTKTMIDKLVEDLKSADTLVTLIRSNPYALIEKCNGIGWARADEIADKAGVRKDSSERIRAYIKYYLQTLAEGDGHTWVPISTLAENVRGLVHNISNERLQTIIRDLVNDNSLYYDRQRKMIGLTYYYNLECDICRELMRIRDSECAPLEGVEEVIEECEEHLGYCYTDEQKAAIRMLCENSVSLVTGGGGVGKTTIMLPFTRILARNGLSFAQCALSGKAALNLTETTGEGGCTIHRLLGCTPNGTFGRDEKRPLEQDIIILDEVSMVGGELFLPLLKAIRDGARLVMIGDSNQLESIGVCNLISDIRSSGKIANANLTKIFRQAAKSGIITDSTKVYKQIPIVPREFFGHEVHGELQDLDIYSEQSTSDCINRVIELYKDIHFNQGVSTEDIAVVCAKRCLGETSAVSLNNRIQSLLNFGGDCVIFNHTDGSTKYSIKYHLHDRVMVTQNDYEAELDGPRAEDGSRRTTQIFNGNFGTVIKVDPIRDKIVVRFDQGDVIFYRENLATLQLGYASTCHKLQGSSSKHVIVLCDPASYVMLTKEWLYTALTRAKKHCYLVSTYRAIDTCVKTTRVIKKQTWLGHLLADAESYKEEKFYNGNW